MQSLISNLSSAIGASAGSAGSNNNTFVALPPARSPSGIPRTASLSASATAGEDASSSATAASLLAKKLAASERRKEFLKQSLQAAVSLIEQLDLCLTQLHGEPSTAAFLVSVDSLQDGKLTLADAFLETCKAERARFTAAAGGGSGSTDAFGLSIDTDRLLQAIFEGGSNSGSAGGSSGADIGSGAVEAMNKGFAAVKGFAQRVAVTLKEPPPPSSSSSAVGSTEAAGAGQGGAGGERRQSSAKLATSQDVKGDSSHDQQKKAAATKNADGAGADDEDEDDDEDGGGGGRGGRGARREADMMVVASSLRAQLSRLHNELVHSQQVSQERLAQEKSKWLAEEAALKSELESLKKKAAGCGAVSSSATSLLAAENSCSNCKTLTVDLKAAQSELQLQLQKAAAAEESALISRQQAEQDMLEVREECERARLAAANKAEAEIAQHEKEKTDLQARLSELEGRLKEAEEQQKVLSNSGSNGNEDRMSAALGEIALLREQVERLQSVNATLKESNGNLQSALVDKSREAAQKAARALAMVKEKDSRIVALQQKMGSCPNCSGGVSVSGGPNRSSPSLSPQLAPLASSSTVPSTQSSRRGSVVAMAQTAGTGANSSPVPAASLMQQQQQQLQQDGGQGQPQHQLFFDVEQEGDAAELASALQLSRGQEVVLKSTIRELEADIRRLQAQLAASRQQLEQLSSEQLDAVPAFHSVSEASYLRSALLQYLSFIHEVENNSNNGNNGNNSGNNAASPSGGSGSISTPRRSRSAAGSALSPAGGGAWLSSFSQALGKAVGVATAAAGLQVARKAQLESIERVFATILRFSPDECKRAGVAAPLAMPASAFVARSPAAQHRHRQSTSGDASSLGSSQLPPPSSSSQLEQVGGIGSGAWDAVTLTRQVTGGRSTSGGGGGDDNDVDAAAAVTGGNVGLPSAVPTAGREFAQPVQSPHVAAAGAIDRFSLLARDSDITADSGLYGKPRRITDIDALQ